MSGNTPEYEVPYQFTADGGDTFHMAISLYLGGFLQRLGQGHSMSDVLAADIIRAGDWKKEVDKQLEQARPDQTAQAGNPSRLGRNGEKRK